MYRTIRNVCISVHAITFACLFMLYGFTMGMTFFAGMSVIFWSFVFFSELAWKSNSTRFKRIHKYISMCVVIGVGMIISVNGLILSEANSKVDDYTEIDYAVVLGAGLNGAELSNRLKMRLDLAYDQLKDCDIPIVLSGGQGPDELVSEADAMFRYLTEKGIDPAQLIKESQSTSTQENIKYSSKLIKKRDVNVVIFTSDYHMYRSKMLGERMGWKTEGYAAVNPLSVRMNYMFRETLALMKDMIIYTY